MSVLDRPFKGGASASRRTRSLIVPVRRPSALIIILVFLIVAIAGTVPLIQNSDATARGYTLRDLEQQHDELRAQLHGMEAEAAMLGARSRIEQTARDRLGMILPEHTIYVQVNVPGPTSRSLPAQNMAIPDQGTATEESSSSLWKRLLEALKP